jgi:translation initiation factor 1
MNLKNEHVSKDIFNKFNENIKKNKIYNQDVHIRLQQRNGRKSLTTVQGLNYRYDHEKILKSLKKEFCCNGCVIENSSLGIIIQLQGDQRQNTMNFFIRERVSEKKKIKIHGI